MIEETIVRMRQLNECWANDPLTPKGEKEVMTEVMDLLPDLLSELEKARGHAAHLMDALDACERESGWVPKDTPLPVYIGEMRKERDAAQKACAEMRDVLLDIERECENTAAETIEIGHSDGPYLWGRVRDRLRLVIKSTDCGKGYVSRDELEKAKDDTDNEWLDAIATNWMALTKTPWETLDGECREEGVQNNISALFQWFEDNCISRDEVKPLVEMLVKCREVLFQAECAFQGAPSEQTPTMFVVREQITELDKIIPALAHWRKEKHGD